MTEQLVISVDNLSGVLQLPDILMLLGNVAVIVGDVDGGDEVVDELLLVVVDGMYAELDVAVNAHVGIEHVLANMLVPGYAWLHGVAEERCIEHANLAPEAFYFGVGITETADFLHSVVQGDEEAVAVVV